MEAGSPTRFCETSRLNGLVGLGLFLYMGNERWGGGVFKEISSSKNFVCMCAKSLQLCLTLCNPMDCSPLNSSVHGILQARILEWVAMPSSRGSS